MPFAPRYCFAIGVVALNLLAAGCSSGSGAAGSGGNGSGGKGSGGSGSGGSTSSGGGNGSGGVTSSGGSGSGGRVGTGGSPSTGGTSGSGGATSSGGATGSGGSTTTSTGGAMGTGGAAGATGTGGSAGGATGNGGGAGPGGTPFFTDDFESDTMGKQPAGFDNFIAYNYKTTNPQSDGTGAFADDMHTHNGSKLAVRFKASGGNPVLLERALPTGTNHLYLRAFVFSTVQLGNGPSGDNHETLLGITADPASVNTQIRFGMIKGAIGTNQVPSDNIAPIMAKWYMPPVITANAWHCIELEFDGSATYNTLRASSDGTLVHSITAATDWQNGALAANWMNGMFVDVMLGWQSFSSTAADVWMDDLALSTTGPIGCN